MDGWSLTLRRSKTSFEPRRLLSAEGKGIPVSLEEQIPDVSEDLKIVLPVVVEPCDVEDILGERRSYTLYSITPTKSRRKMLEFPADDIEVNISCRDSLTLQNFTMMENLERHIRDILNFYSDDFSLVNRKYLSYSSDENDSRWKVERLSVMNTLRPQIFFRTCGSSDPPVPVLQEYEDNTKYRLPWESSYHATMLQKATNREKESLFKTFRGRNRLNHIINFLTLDNKNPLKRMVPPVPDEVCYARLVVQVAKVKMESFVEPLFGSMAIYDGQRRIKLTETFYFNLVDDDKLALTGNQLSNKLNRCLQSAFSLSCPLNDLFLVLRFDKVLQQGDNSNVYNIGKDEKATGKLTVAAAENWRKFGAYRMPVGVQVIDLYELFQSNLAQAKASPLGTISTTDEKNDDRQSIISSDRISGVTDRRSGISAAKSVLERVKTPLAKRKNSQKHEDMRALDVPKDSREFIDNLPVVTVNIRSLIKLPSEKYTEDEILRLCDDVRYFKLNRDTFNFDLDLQISGINKSHLSRHLASTSNLNDESSLNECAVIGNNVNASTYSNTLYIYPKSLNFSGKGMTARNIAIKVELLDGNESRLCAVYEKGASSKGPFTKFALTTVLYHQRNPTYSDEIKIQIPANLNSGHHLLFTFYHVKCKESERGPVETVVAYTWLPLYQHSTVRCGLIELPVCSELPAPGYGYHKCKRVPDVKWLDGGNNVYKLAIKVVSTVHTQDDHLTKFFDSVSSLSSLDMEHPPVSEAKLMQNIADLLKATPDTNYSFLHYTLDRLLFLMANPPYSERVTQRCFDTICEQIKICSDLLDIGAKNLNRSLPIAAFYTYRKVANRESKPHSNTRPVEIIKPQMRDPCLLYDETRLSEIDRPKAEKNTPPSPTTLTNSRFPEVLAENILRCAHYREVINRYAWFFLELLHKSCCEYVSMTGRLTSPRKGRFAPAFTKNVETIVDQLTKDSIAHKDVAHGYTSVIAIAYFVRDSFSIMDRTFVMKLFQIFTERYTSAIMKYSGRTATNLMVRKMKFTRIVCSHEHFATLNVPNDFDNSRSGFWQNSALELTQRESEADWQLSDPLRRLHYLSGTVLSDLQSCLQARNDFLCSRAVENLQLMLRTHELDDRIEEKATVAAAYKPLLAIVLENRKFIFASKTNQAKCEKAMGTSTMTESTATGISSPKSNATSAKAEEPFNKMLLCCLFWVLKNVGRDTCRNWLRFAGLAKTTELLRLFRDSVAVFEFEEEIMDVPKSIDDNKSWTDTNKWRYSALSSHNSDTGMAQEVSMNEAAVSCEVLINIAELLETICTLADMEKTHVGIVPKAFSIILQVLSANVSEQVLEVYLALQQIYTARFSFIVEEKSEVIIDLCRLLLHHGVASTLHNSRVLASVSIYQVLRESFKKNNNLKNAKKFMATALSDLFSGSYKHKALLSSDSMEAVSTFVVDMAKVETCIDYEMQKSFIEQVADITSNLQKIMQNTILTAVVNDYEKSIDHYYHLLEGYANNPDLRIKWLLKMAQTHLTQKLETDQKHHVEAAQCYLHACALSAEYIDRRTLSIDDSNFGAATFAKISINVLQECNVTKFLPTPTDHRVESFYFTESGLLELIDKAFEQLKEAKLYEVLFLLSEIKLRILLGKKDYAELAKMHESHSLLPLLIKEVDQGLHYRKLPWDPWLTPVTDARRKFAEYFRVKFYGAGLGDLNQKEFVYQWPQHSKISEPCAFLENYYNNKVGRVIIIGEAGDVKLENLDENLCYIQVTHVNVYLSDDELLERTTNFEQGNNIRRFVYEYVGSSNGSKDRDDHSKVSRTRVILTTDCSFPYIRNRVQVVCKETQNLSPIEHYIEDICGKTANMKVAQASLAQVINTSVENFIEKREMTTDEYLKRKVLKEKERMAKEKEREKAQTLLGMQLQGTVAPTVNRGLQSVADVFLANAVPDFHGRPSDRKQNLLRLLIRDLRHASYEALELHRQELRNAQIPPEQKDQKLNFQAQLDKSFVELDNYIRPIINRTKVEDEITFSEFGEPTVV